MKVIFEPGDVVKDKAGNRMLVLGDKSNTPQEEYTVVLNVDDGVPNVLVKDAGELTYVGSWNGDIVCNIPENEVVPTTSQDTDDNNRNVYNEMSCMLQGIKTYCTLTNCIGCVFENCPMLKNSNSSPFYWDVLTIVNKLK